MEISIVDRNGNEGMYEVPEGIQLNLMEFCKALELPVEGTCGGMALCASCHVYVESDHNILDRSDVEEEMLDMTFNVQPNSRLGCQIILNEELEGLKVRLAPQPG